MAAGEPTDRDWLRMIYRRLPVSERTRVATKSMVYTLLSPILRGHPSFEQWAAERRESATDERLRQSAGRGTSAALPRHFSDVFSASLRAGPYFSPGRPDPVPPSSLRTIA